jgi:hypothetical protein
MYSTFTFLPSFSKLIFLFLCLLFLATPVDAQDSDSFNRVLSINSPWFVDFGNINGDDIRDLVGVNGNSNSDINIYHGKNDGTFELKTTLPGNGEYYRVFLTALNADQIADIIAVSDISGIMYLSSPAGYVEADLPASGMFDVSATLFADFNNDGAQDVFIRGQTLINNEDGTFTSKSSIAGNGGAVVTNFNNDNFQDIVMTNPGGGIVSVYKGKGDGTFETPMTKTLTVYESIAHDLNADGFVDLIFKGYNGAIEVLYNDASFSFSETLSFNLGHNFATTINVFDIDHNGVRDLVTSNDNHIQYRPILSDGTFGSEMNFAVGMGSLRSLLYRDVIGEDFPDMVVMSGFGSTRIYSDKLNATLQFTATEKIYDGEPFAGFYRVSPHNVATAVSYAGLANAPRNAGSYGVTINVDDLNYESDPLEGTISVAKRALTVDVTDISVMQTQPIPPFTLLYTGFVGTENESLLAQKPVASSTSSSALVGDYQITISGGADENYAFEYETGVLTVTELIVGIVEEIAIEVYPNPATDEIVIKHPRWTVAEMYDVTGHKVVVATNFSHEPISITGCAPGVYSLYIHLNDGRYLRKKVLIH